VPLSRLSGEKSSADQSFSSLAQTPSRSNSKQAIPQDVDATFVSELGEINDAVVQQVPIQDGIPPGSALVLTPDDDDATFGVLHDEPETQPLPDVRGNSPRQATYPVQVLPASIEERRSKSYDDGTRPLHKLFGNGNGAPDAGAMSTWNAGNLNIPGRVTTKAERRMSRISMNPPPRTLLPDDSPDDPRGRRVSSGSEASAYYSPKSLERGRASPSGGQLEADSTSRSLHRSPSASHHRSNEEALFAKPRDTPASSPSFPPREQSLRNPKATEIPNNTSAASASATRPKPPEPSVAIEPASDDDAELTLVPPPPSTGDLPSRPSTPNTAPDATSAPSTPPVPPPASLSSQPDEESTPVQQRRVAPPPLAPPALPPIRLSIHSYDFADLLKDVAEGSPKVPMPRDSQLRLPTVIVGDGGRNSDGVGEDDEAPPSPSVLARRRIAASQTLPAMGHDRGESVGGESSQCTTPTQAGLSHSSPETAASSPTAPTPSPSAPVALSSTPRRRTGSSPSHPDNARKAPSALPSVPPSSGSAVEQRDSGRTGSTPLANGNEAVELRPLPRRTDPAAELMSKRLREALADANSRGAASLKFDPQFVEALLRSLESSKEAYSGLKSDLDSVRVCSHTFCIW